MQRAMHYLRRSHFHRDGIVADGFGVRRACVELQVCSIDQWNVGVVWAVAWPEAQNPSRETAKNPESNDKRAREEEKWKKYDRPNTPSSVDISPCGSSRWRRANGGNLRNSQCARHDRITTIIRHLDTCNFAGCAWCSLSKWIMKIETFVQTWNVSMTNELPRAS